MVGDKPPWTQNTLLSIKADKLHVQSLCVTLMMRVDGHQKAVVERHRHVYTAKGSAKQHKLLVYGLLGL